MGGVVLMGRLQCGHGFEAVETVRVTKSICARLLTHSRERLVKKRMEIDLGAAPIALTHIRYKTLRPASGQHCGKRVESLGYQRPSGLVAPNPAIIIAALGG